MKQEKELNSKYRFNDLKPGMKLSADIIDFRGRLILSRGQILDEKSLWKLKMWGVTEAEVVLNTGQPSSPDMGDPELEAKRDKIKVEQDIIFKASRYGDKFLSIE